MKPVLVDITRTLSRAFKPIPTGIDRVERAYIDHFLTVETTRFVGRMGSSVYVLDCAHMAAILRCIDGAQTWETPAFLATLGGLRDADAAAVRATLADHCWYSGSTDGALSALQDAPGAWGSYLNVGHTNLDAPWLAALKQQLRLRLCCMIHDMIPLDHPEYQTPDSVKRFQARAKNVATYADRVIANSKATAARVEHWFQSWGGGPEVVAIPLGIAETEPLSTEPAQPSYFIMLGTIEPRKNHALILDAWELLPPDNPPVLHIVGTRGWNNDAVFKRLDALASSASVVEHGPLSDGETRAFLAGASALLFPSLVEGFGLPVFEALQLRTPVVANRLPVLEELAGNSLLYMDSQDAKVWSTIISRIAKSSWTGTQPEEFDRVTIPRWNAHFQQLEAILI